MSNTIEKALLRQKEAERQKKEAELEASPSPSEKPAEYKGAAEEKLPAVDSENTEKPDLSDREKNKVSVPNGNQQFVEQSFDIDVADLENRGFVSLHSTRTLINEEYREIKRKLLSNAFGPLSKTLVNPNIIMVTSARASEGKTFTAVNLALSIAAEQDKRVLLVDADVLRPNILRTLGLENRSGLMEYLLGDIKEIGQTMFRSNIDKLRIIPAGRSHHLSTELLASKAMSDLITEFSSRYHDRVVIIDTPPIIGINESAVLANFAGQAVVVVEEGGSTLSDTQKAVERLNPEMAIGFVVNKSLKTSDQTNYLGYHYHQRDD